MKSAKADETSGVSEIEADAAVVIEAFDSDGDGILNPSESAFAGFMHGKARSAWLKDADKNGDSKLSKEEFMTSHREMSEGVRPKRKARILDLFDANKDGKLESAEKAAVKGMQKAQIEEMKLTSMARVKAFDKDGDGKLGSSEVLARNASVDKQSHVLRIAQAKVVDKNSDGKVDENELAELKKHREEARNAALAKSGGAARPGVDARELVRSERSSARKSIDVNNDGIATSKEIEAATSSPVF